MISLQGCNTITDVTRHKMEIRPFILHQQKISEVPAQEDTFHTKPWKHWGYPEVNLLYLAVVGFLLGLHKLFFHFHW